MARFSLCLGLEARAPGEGSGGAAPERGREAEMRTLFAWIAITAVVVAGSHWLGVVVRETLIAR